MQLPILQLILSIFYDIFQEAGIFNPTCGAILRRRVQIWLCQSPPQFCRLAEAPLRFRKANSRSMARIAKFSDCFRALRKDEDRPVYPLATNWFSNLYSKLLDQQSLSKYPADDLRQKNSLGILFSRVVKF